MTAAEEIAASYAHCHQLARAAASNFFYAFLLLPRAKRAGMYALYAFMRRTDDLGDNEQPADRRRADLAAWRESLTRALAGTYDDPILPALADTVRRYSIPPQCLMEVLDGVEMDLEPRRYETFDELETYCHRVASAVGLACLHIWGFSSDEALAPARQCGLAFQLTNILRDVKEDLARGRVYLPLEDLKRFDYSEEDLRGQIRDDRFRRLMRHEIDRTERLYEQAAPLEQYLTPDGRRAFRVMLSTYHGLLAEIRRRDGDVFSQRVRLGALKKLGIVAGGWFLWPRHFFPQPAGVRTS